MVSVLCYSVHLHSHHFPALVGRFLLLSLVISLAVPGAFESILAVSLTVARGLRRETPFVPTCILMFLVGFELCPGRAVTKR